MRTAHILLLCILGAALLSPVLCDNNGLIPDKCCVSYLPMIIPKSVIKSYYMSDDRCPKPATILVTKKSRLICVDPSQPWVVSVMKHLNEKSFRKCFSKRLF